MTQTVFKAFLGVLFLSSLSLHPAAGAKVRGGWNTTEVKQDVEDLKSALAKIQDYKTKRDQAQEELDTNILDTNGRQTTYNEAMMDAAILNNYRSDAWDDVGCLQDHWKHLTSGEKDLVARAKTDLNGIE